MKFTIEMDELLIDPRALSEAVFLEVGKKAMAEVLADHGLKMDRSQRPDGSPQKANSPGYAARKSSPGILVGGRSASNITTRKRENLGGRRVSGEIPTILTGDMKRSRHIMVSGNEVQGKFDSEGGTKARELVKMGYGLHYFSKQNIDAIKVRYESELGIQASKAIKVRRRT